MMFSYLKKFQKGLILGGIFCLGLLSCPPLSASGGKTDQQKSLEISLSTNKYVLENGLTVLISEMPSTSVVSVYGLVNTGSAVE